MKLAKRLQSLTLGASLLAAGLPAWAVVDSRADRPCSAQSAAAGDQDRRADHDLHWMMLIICR
jgi:cytochrome c oxidase subunit 2